MKNNSLSIQEAIDMVREFHDAFGIENAIGMTANPEKTEFELRHRLMKEENDEYLDAAKDEDMTEVADALGDMLYILCGTILKHGLEDKIAPLFKEIHRSNMSKLDENGKPIYRSDGKILKSTRYFKPDILKIIDE